MKTNKTRPDKLYTLKQISIFFRIPVVELRERCKSLRIRMTPQIGQPRKYILTQDQMRRVIEFHAIAIPEVITQHIVWEIRESKLNFMVD
jgi:hypothetical protein